MDLYALWIIYSLALCFILSYILIYFYTNILLPPFIHSLIYTLLYYKEGIYSCPHFYTLPLIYSLIYNGRNYLCPYFTHHIPLLMPILYTVIYHTIFSPPPFFTTLLYTLYCPSSYILLYSLSYIERV